MIINECESNLKQDYKLFLEKLVPQLKYAHNSIDENAGAHLLGALIGNSVTIPIKDRKLMLGTWQSIIFCELDGPRERKVIIQLI